jgi:hypothetical protein
MNEEGIYEEPSTAAGQPTTEASAPGGGGVQSSTGDGGKKVDPISAGPNTGNTIAGRWTDAAAGVDSSRKAGDEAASDSSEMTDESDAAGRQTGGPDTAHMDRRALQA